MLSRPGSKEEINGESVVALEDCETDGMGRDEGGSKALHAVVVDEASCGDGAEGGVDGRGVVDLDATVVRKLRGESREA
jgi:hypothetical protein